MGRFKSPGFVEFVKEFSNPIDPRAFCALGVGGFVAVVPGLYGP